MLFTDARFFPFLGITFAVYYLLRSGRWQIVWLLAASLFFYAYNQPWLLLLLLLSATITLTISDRILKTPSLSAKRGWAAAGVVTNLTVLGFFKYAGFLYVSATGTHSGIGQMLLAIPLPIGISFYTFHGISLLVDLLRTGPQTIKPRQDGRNASFAERGLVYLTFFPQLIAGPIVKARDFFPQIHHHAFRDIDWPAACHALVVGYFLKSVIADNLAEQTFWLQYPYFVPLSSLNLAVLLFGYSIQIFADFAGYSLIAIGLGHLFGYQLPDNFRFPYIAETFSEFWTRWHISLSSWLRDYLYIPLGGNRKGRLRTYANLMIVMALGGLWHGAGWSYALWGMWHGAALSLERMLSDSWFYRSRALLMRVLRTLLVFGVVSAGWLLFKLPEFRHVLTFVTALKTNIHSPINLGGPMMILLYGLPVVGYHAAYLWRRVDRPNSAWLAVKLRPLLYGSLLALIATNSGPATAFIYFQF